MRIDAGDDLAIKLEHQTQYPMGRRVLGPEIDGEIANSFNHGSLMRAAYAAPPVSAGSKTHPTVDKWVFDACER